MRIADCRNMNNETPLTRSFWSFNVGHAITIAMLLVSIIGLYFRVDSRLSAVELLATDTKQQLEQIDANGTRKSQLGLSQDLEMVRANTNRVAAVEKIVAELAPKLERIDTNIQWLMSTREREPQKRPE